MAQAHGGVEQSYQKELGANRAVRASQVDAAGQIRNAGLEAAKLRQAAAVITQVWPGDFKRSWTMYAETFPTSRAFEGQRFSNVPPIRTFGSKRLLFRSLTELGTKEF